MRTVNHKKRAEKTAQILDAVKKVFVEKGFHQTGMQELCKAADTSPGAMYSYFASKSDIIAAVAEQALEPVYHLAEVLVSSADPIAILKVALDYNHENSADSRLLMDVYSEGMRNEEVGKLVNMARETLLKAIEAALKAKGLKEEDLLNVSRLVLGLYDSALVHDILGVPMDAESMVKLLEELLASHNQDNTVWKKAAGKFSAALFSK